MSKPPVLYSRDEFRTRVFERDDGHCVICGDAGRDAHHIMERRLFDDGGYYLENGVTLCEQHHIKAEQTLISCDQLRTVAKIKRIILPSHLYSDEEYDKWGNIILKNKQRLRGELFFDESVQKILASAGILTAFTNRVKYPRTYHLPFSPGLTKDDRQIESCDQFVDKEVVVTLKMDGEQTTWYHDYMHSRSLELERHPARSWVQQLHAQLAYEIPKDWRICGENLYQKHSIQYNNLEKIFGTFFLAFSVWTEKSYCLDWDSTIEWFELLGLKSVPILYRGIWDEKIIRELHQPFWHGEPAEGFVVRAVDGFPLSAFRWHVAKYVRANHVATDVHCMRMQEVIRNH